MKKTWQLVALVSVLADPVMAQDADAGKKVFKKCAACHQVGEGAKNKVGPVLTDVIGRAAGSIEGYKYSKSMAAAGVAGLIWDEDLIFDYIADPKQFLREYLNDPKARAKMTFKLKKPEDRQNVIAYLGTFQSAMMAPALDGFCVVNASQEQHLFVTETREGERQLSELAPGESLCAAGTSAKDGIVSVFENADGFEGCSRIIATGSSEEMLEYAEFDRCGWSSNQS